MKFLLPLFVLLLCVTTKSFTQSNLSDYSFVAIPERFDFLTEKDQFQLNSLTKFLFDKHGFHAYFLSELPNVRRCDGLWAEVEGTPGFIRAKIEVVLKDCNGVELFRTQEGKSKDKDFKKAYYESLRTAFKSIEGLNVQQKELVLFDEPNETEEPITKKVEIESTDNSIKVTTSNTFAEQDQKKSHRNIPQQKYLSYSKANKSYLLRKTSEGFSLYEESSSQAGDGLLLIGKIEIMDESKIYFIDTSENMFKAYFDKTSNLIIEKGENRETYTAVN